MYAPKFHPAMRFAGPVRREIGIRTAFNILGPLTNPARARHQVLGVPDAALAEKMARALARLDTVHALVVHGHGGLDALALSGPPTGASASSWRARASIRARPRRAWSRWWRRARSGEHARRKDAPMPQQWDADIELSVVEAGRLIEQQFPELAPAQLEQLGIG